MSAMTRKKLRVAAPLLLVLAERRRIAQQMELCACWTERFRTAFEGLSLAAIRQALLQHGVEPPPIIRMAQDLSAWQVQRLQIQRGNDPDDNR